MIDSKDNKLNLLSCKKKVVVFDMDETLGHFVELGMFWDALQNYFIKKGILYDEEEKNKKFHFYKVLDLFPEFIRPNIIKILKYIILKKNKNKCNKIIIYTNNQGPKSWANIISNYFEYVINKPIFDVIIGAFKIKGKHIEQNRTTYDKTVDDLKSCSNLSNKTNICFIDDQYHSKMKSDDVYYINVKPYIYSLEYSDMAKRYYDQFKNTILKDVSKDEFIDYIISFMNKYNYNISIKTNKEFKIDKFISKRIMCHLKCFFNNTNNKTLKKKKQNINKSSFTVKG